MNVKYALIGVALLSVACHKNDNSELSHHHHEHTDCSHHHDHDDAEEDIDVINLSPETAALFNLETTPAEVRQFCSVVKVGAVVLPSTEGVAVVSAPASGIVTIAKGIEPGVELGRGTLVATIKADDITGGDANRIASVELAAAKAEFDRVESLYADRLVTLAEYNAAYAAYEKASAAFSASAASGRAVSPIAGVVTALDAISGQFVEAGTRIATVSAATQILIRADVPLRDYRLIANTGDAQAEMSDGSIVNLSDIGARRLDLNNPAASSGGYVPITFSVNNNGTFMPGQSIVLYLLGPADHQGLAVLSTAVTEAQGTFFVYEQLDEDCYRRLPVTIGASDGRYTEILSGLEPGKNIVSKGVTAVKLAQASGAVPEGHSHSH